VSSRSNIVISLIVIGIIFGSVGVMIMVSAPYQPSVVGVVVMAPGFGDMSMADTIEEGLHLLASDISVQYIFPDPLPTNVAGAQEWLTTFAKQSNINLIIAIGSDLTSAVSNVAQIYSDKKFALIGGSVPLPNVASAEFESQEAAFLGGVVAAFVANAQPYFGTAKHTGEIGILAAMQDREITTLVNGFIQGVVAANETYNLNVTLKDPVFLNSWNTSEAQSKIYSMFVDDNMSIIFAPVRASYWAVRAGMLQAQAAFPFTQRLRMPLVIAAEGDLDYYGTANPQIPVAPSWITTSVWDRSDLAVYRVINLTLWDQFPAGEYIDYNLANGGCNITNFLYSSTYIPASLTSAIDSYTTLITNGTIFVDPATPLTPSV
jgi:basic membrane lipoprotein Med (substrate-binding protein (PBP1-ABC) superfamily)